MFDHENDMIAMNVGYLTLWSVNMDVVEGFVINRAVVSTGVDPAVTMTMLMLRT